MRVALSVRQPWVFSEHQPASPVGIEIDGNQNFDAEPGIDAFVSPTSTGTDLPSDTTFRRECFG